MRELHTCDFCGTDATGVFEVLPPALTPVDDQWRVVLCEHCEETLGEVTMPLLFRFGVGADMDVADDVWAETGVFAAPERTMSRSGGEVTSIDVNAVNPAPAPPEPADHDSPDEGDDAGPPGDDANDNDGVDDEAEVETEAEVRAETENEPSAPVADEQSRPDGEFGRGEGSPKFRRVTRIFQNREFLVERAEIEALASGACDLDDDEVADIFGYVIERGLLIDNSGALRWS